MSLHKFTTDYTVSPNEIFRHNLSLKAIGLYLYILNKPDGWNFSIKGTMSQVNDGDTSIRTAIDELQATGFLSLVKTRSEGGKFQKGDWIVYDSPHVENPRVENQRVENPVQVNTNIVNTKEDLLEKAENPIVSLDQTVIGLPKTAQTFKKDRKVKQAFRGAQAPQIQRPRYQAKEQGTIEESLHDNLSTPEEIKALAKELKVTPEQVEFTKKSYLLWVQDKKVLGANMRNTVARWLLKSLTEGKIEVHLNAAEQHNKEMWELINSIEDGSFKI